MTNTITCKIEAPQAHVVRPGMLFRSTVTQSVYMVMQVKGAYHLLDLGDGCALNSEDYREKSVGFITNRHSALVFLGHRNITVE